MSIRAVIIDDEYLSTKELIFLLSKISYIDVVGQANCGKEGLDLIRTLQPDLVFLDIEMPDITGMQLSKEILKLGIPCKIIFTTAYDQYAIEAFDVDAVDYILKPYEEKRVIKAAKKAKGIIENEKFKTKKEFANSISLNKLSILKEDTVKLIDIEEIVLIYAEDRNIYIKTEENIFQSHFSLQELENKLGDKGFFRTHRSYLVNLNKIKEVSPWFNGSYVAKVEGFDGEVPISRNKVKSFKEILGI
ncbi:LytR/AlgR family response regulator transcription factor [Garciella nitratireducens]|uniref:Stage 0 sporulation protein A homolog n=1 Tax=Garciella nitratireducens DSM 15102 TaxID=1121911 RepID=A0A1T4M9B0_9FIRM|nr:LytTR family DNA-binding domain-containing protein [Garciella nitratireducens]SJZ63294.1 two component transcriptional regulator, LytTR family [Garciella nitratireducens DSM 15102]